MVIRQPRFQFQRNGSTAGLLAAFALLLGIHGFAEEEERPPLVRASIYSEFTIVVCNRAVPGSEALARYYARSREISERNVVVLDCSTSEEISRSEFEAQIHDPLRDQMLSRGWWMPIRDPETGAQSLRSNIKVLTLIHGVPAKIREDAVPATPGETTAASVDSELSTLGQPGLTLAGPLANPYYQSEIPFHSANLPIMLVGRIDGPDAPTCRRMIDDTIRAESQGLWGQAYIDLGGDQSLAHTWLRSAATRFRQIGIPVTVNQHAESFPTNYPMGDPVLYLGAGSESLNGPFLRSGKVLRPGAIAVHAHPRNAATLRSTQEYWAGPLLDKGAAAVLGSAYETPHPFSHQLDIFSDRLTRGFSFIESAYMSLQGVSWVNLAIGDPLYTPFPDLRTTIDETQFKRKRANMPYQVLRLAYARWGDGNPFPERALFYKLELASAKQPRPEFLEHLAISAIETEDYDEARIQLMRAEAAYEKPVDQLRIRLHKAEMFRRQGDRLDAFKILRDAAEDFAAIPEAKAAIEWMEIVKKPGS